MFHVATGGSHRLADVFGPFPAGFVSGPPDRHAAHLDQFELALLEDPRFVWILEPLENDIARQSADSCSA